MLTARSVLERFLAARELEPGSVRYYRAQVSVFCGWFCADAKASATVHSGENLKDGDAPLDIETVNRFLHAKYADGKSWPYRKALRAALTALLNFSGVTGKVRSVRSHPLDPETWTAAEVDRIVAAAPDEWWKTLIEAAYWTGLAQNDLALLERRHFAVGGVLKWRRRKTGTMVVVSIPQELLERLPAKGKCWPKRFSNEYFRRFFKRIVRVAKLTGTFKRLRKSSGTSVEERHPGCGHMHLGNTRRVFELHYLSRKNLRPLTPEPIAPHDRTRPPGDQNP